MTETQIKRSLYREKPMAIRYSELIILSGIKTAVYYTYLKNGTKVTYRIPCRDMGDKLFDDKVPSQLLIRWME